MVDVDTGSPPLEVQEMWEEKRRAMMEDDEPELGVTITDTYPTGDFPESQPLEMPQFPGTGPVDIGAQIFTPPPSDPWAGLPEIKITLHTPFGLLNLATRGLSVGDDAVAILLPESSIDYSPAVGVTCWIDVGDESYTVVFAGGRFTFPGLPFIVLTFLRETIDGEERES